ncbi:hypothetical protein F5Y05DRAFT_415982 [Hypoxylon sp. FL0543]|nr:hypothetical protein F5Y05DRAFT_415982 [Hypoxylon sp. FL0543]
MDPLSALSIAAAVVQFVDFGSRLLIRTWDRYRRFEENKSKQGPEGAKTTYTEDDELEKISRQISQLDHGVQEAAERLPPGWLSTPAKDQLEKLRDECSNVHREFQDVITRIRHRPLDRFPIAGQITRFALAGIWNSEKIRVMQNRLKELQDLVMSVVLFCLWESSKKTAQWEYQFSSQLDELVGVVRKVEDSTSKICQNLTSRDAIRSVSVLQVAEDVSASLDHKPGMNSLRETYKSRAGATRALLPLIEAGQAISLRQVADNIVQTLEHQDLNISLIGEELTALLWRPDWRMDKFKHERLIGQEFAHMNLPKLVEHITADLCFTAFTAREEAITHSFKETYAWIFSRQPKESNGELLWPSFPEWLEGGCESPYWITGKPGSGKSTIMKFIVENNLTASGLKRWSEPLPLLTLSYYAWNSGYSMQKSWEGLKRTLIFQALKLNPKLISSITPRRWTLAYALRGTRSFPRWETWEVEESFNFLLQECGKSVKIALFIDGLDEFDIPPLKVVELIHGLQTTGAGSSIKLCVASRPWTEFDDAFYDGPTLQMHLLTQDDMTTFVTHQFDKSRGFQEMKHIYPNEASSLAGEIVSKAQGVFLWVSLVVRSLLRSLSEGTRMSDIRKTLEQLPSDISSLYDAVWHGISEKNRYEASWMMQFTMAAHGPMPWFTMWLADESKTARVDIDLLPNDIKYHAKISLKRRLATRTRGILEIAGQNVDFSHRTARDWAAQQQVWENICSVGQNTVDPYLMLTEAETLVLSEPGKALNYSHDNLWEAIYKVLWYATRVIDSAENTPRLIDILDFFDQRVLMTWHQAQPPWPKEWKLASGQHWSERQNRTQAGRRNTFLGIVAQFGILPYVREKVLSDKTALRQKSSKECVGLLENAQNGFRHFMAGDFRPPVELPELLVDDDVVEFLYDQGVTRKISKAIKGPLVSRLSSILKRNSKV